MNKTSSSSSAGVSRRNDTNDVHDGTQVEGIALCSALTLTFILVVVGNLLTIVIFAKNKNIRKKYLFLVVNMAFADLFLGALSLPVYIYDVGHDFHLWTTFVGNLWTNKPILISYMIVDTAFSQASLISAVFITCERFYAIRWPFKHRNLSTQAYHIAIFSVWVLALLISATVTGSNLLFSYKYIVFFGGPYILTLILIICGCNIGIWQKFQTERVAASHQESRDLQNKRLTKTLLIVSGLTLLAWLPLVLLNFLMFVWVFHVPRRFYDMVNLFNYFNSFVNPIFYALRIAEFRRALALCCTGRHVQAAVDTKFSKRRKERHRTTAEFSREVAFEQDVMDTEFSREVAFEQDVMDTEFSRELAFEQNVMDTEFSRELAFEQDVLDTEFSIELAFEQDVMDTKL
ncbi:adenosine receptor A3-like [Pocillopora verrucosa]|uniref:adenosine receptor A3-like n=1 Tax=Pocillopora verrucosa TaxID=203993 RepID=UPI003341C75E